jgi:hypothetical protein
MAIPELIYCSDGNKRFASIAIEAGFRYGAQVPNTVYFQPYFCDQNWRKPNREKYMAALGEYKPHLATVLDWEQSEQLSEVLDWAEEATQHIQEAVIIIPKVIGSIHLLPRRINGKQVRLGYSVPTKFAGTQVPVWEFEGWPVHLLGGSPKAQYRLTHYMDVYSVDGNYAQKMATRYNQFFVHGSARYASNRWWPTLREANDGNLWGDGTPTADAPYEAFKRSCANIMAMWQQQPALLAA